MRVGAMAKPATSSCFPISKNQESLREVDKQSVNAAFRILCLGEEKEPEVAEIHQSRFRRMRSQR